MSLHFHHIINVKRIKTSLDLLLVDFHFLIFFPFIQIFLNERMGEEVEPCRKNRKNKAPVQVKQKRTSGQTFLQPHGQTNCWHRSGTCSDEYLLLSSRSRLHQGKITNQSQVNHEKRHGKKDKRQRREAMKNGIWKSELSGDWLKKWKLKRKVGTEKKSVDIWCKNSERKFK